MYEFQVSFYGEKKTSISIITENQKSKIKKKVIFCTKTTTSLKWEIIRAYREQSVHMRQDSWTLSLEISVSFV